MNAKLEEIRAVHAAATPGPYRWFGYISGKGISHARSKAERYCTQIYLSTINRGRIIIMNFRRAGMSGAQPFFGDRSAEQATRSCDGGFMRPAAAYADNLRDYSGQFEGLTNPDAIAIEKSWEHREFLLNEIAHLQKMVCLGLRCDVRREFELGNHDDACPLENGYVPTWLREVAS